MSIDPNSIPIDGYVILAGWGSSYRVWGPVSKVTDKSVIKAANSRYGRGYDREDLSKVIAARPDLTSARAAVSAIEAHYRDNGVEHDKASEEASEAQRIYAAASQKARQLGVERIAAAIASISQ